VGLERGVVQGSIFYFTLPATEQPEPAKLVAAGSSGAGG